MRSAWRGPHSTGTAGVARALRRAEPARLNATHARTDRHGGGWRCATDERRWRVARAGGLARVRAPRACSAGAATCRAASRTSSRIPHDGDRLVGFEVEIADALARRLGVRRAFVQNDWQMLVPALERGDCDVVLNGLEVTPARAARVAVLARRTIASRLTLGRPPRRRRRLHGRSSTCAARRVATLGGSLVGGPVAAQAAWTIVLHEGVEEPYLDLEQGRVDGVVLDDIIAARYGAHASAPACARPTVGEGRTRSRPVPTTTDLARAIDDALAAR